MKRTLQLTSIFSLMFVLLSSIASAQTAGFNTTFVVLQVNNGANAYYDLQASTANPDFNGANLGSFCYGSTTGLVFKGAEHNVYKCGGCDLQSTRLYYRIYPAGSPAGTFVSNNIGFSSGGANGCGGEDQQWANTGYNTNLLAGLLPGNYSIEVYSDATTTCLGGTVYAGNGGANYIANFTVTGVTYYADADLDGFGNPAVSQISCTGAPAGYVANSLDCNDAIWYYVDDDGDGFGSTAFSPCQGVLNNSDCDDTLLMYVDNDGDGFGSNTFAACGPTNHDDCDDNLLRYVDNDSDGFGSDIFSACSGVTNSDDCDDADIQYQDLDGDGYGSEIFAGCGVQNSDDCDDTQILYVDDDGDGFGTTVQAACGVANDDDCDDTLLLYLDSDGDGFGSTTFAACGVNNHDDCNDNSVGYEDNDGDGVGSTTTLACGGVATNTDCDDNDDQVYHLVAFYVDADNDGYGFGPSAPSCVGNIPTPDGYSLNNLDCDDNNSAVHPNAPEIGFNLIDDDCDGSVDEGFPPIGTVVQTTYCGSTLPLITSYVYANIATGATGYQWKVTTMTGPAAGQVQLVNTAIRALKMSVVPNVAYGTSYKLEVAVYFSGVLMPFTTSNCTVTTPPATTALAKCGQNLASMSTAIQANNILLATAYRFRVTDPANPLNTQVLERPVREFRMNVITAFPVEWSKTYNVEVSARNGDGTWLPYGQLCTVTTPAFPMVTLQNNQCNSYAVPTSDTPIYADAYAGAVAYAFRITGAGHPAGTEIIRPVRNFRLNDFTGLVPGSTYIVNVRLIMNEADAPGPYGGTCTVIAPSSASRDIEAGHSILEAYAYPNPFSDGFSVSITGGDKASVKVYDMLGRLIESGTSDGSKYISNAVYPAGVYNVVITEGDETRSLKVIKR